MKSTNRKTKSLGQVVLLALLLGLLSLPITTLDADAGRGDWDDYYRGNWRTDQSAVSWNLSVILGAGACWEHLPGEKRLVAGQQTGDRPPDTDHFRHVWERRSQYTFQFGVGAGPWSVCFGPKYEGSDALGKRFRWEGFRVDGAWTTGAEWRKACHAHHPYWYIVSSTLNPCATGRQIAKH